MAIDSWTLQSTPESGHRAGYDGAKKKKGSNIHIPVDTPELVTVRIGHSTLPIGPGSAGAVTTSSTAPIMEAAAEDARKQLLAAIANLNGGDAGEFDIRDGEILRAGEPFMKWSIACAEIGGEQILRRGKTGEGEARRPTQPRRPVR